jgi:DNA-binding FadR family transcriptional regulator
MADACNVSLPTMHAAVVALTFSGLVTARHGIGIFISTKLRASRMLPVSLRRATITELHGLRRDLELASAAAACHRRNDRDLQLLWFASSELRLALIEEIPRFIAEADLEFHRLFVSAARNSLLASLHRAVGIRLREDLIGRAGLIRRAEDLYSAHIAILDDLEAGRSHTLLQHLGSVLSAEGPQT